MLAPYNLVYLSNGNAKPVSEIGYGDEVISVEGKPVKVLKNLKREGKFNLIKMKGNYIDHTSSVFTEDHKIFYKKDDSLEVSELSELKSFYSFFPIHKIKEIKVDKYLAFFFGCYSRKGKVNRKIVKVDFRKELVNCLAEQKLGFDIQDSIVVINDLKFRQFIKDSFGKDRFVPEVIMKANYGAVVNFLFGFTYGEEEISCGKKESRNKLYQIKYLCSRVGIPIAIAKGKRLFKCIVPEIDFKERIVSGVGFLISDKGVFVKVRKGKSFPYEGTVHDLVVEGYSYTTTSFAVQGGKGDWVPVRYINRS